MATKPVTAAPAAPLRGKPVARTVFNGLPASYDRLALGQARRWRAATVGHAAAGRPRLMLDVTTGAAGVAIGAVALAMVPAR